MKLLGGRCKRCRWKGDLASFEFHHRNPKMKEFAVGKLTNRSWKVIKRELKKCDLLCANCHRAEHATSHRDPRFLQELKRYAGRETFN